MVLTDNRTTKSIRGMKLLIFGIRMSDADMDRFRKILVQSCINQPDVSVAKTGKPSADQRYLL